MKLIQARTLAQAWLHASEHLLTTKDFIDTTVVLHIDDPKHVDAPDRRVARTLDTFLVAHDEHCHHTVAGVNRHPKRTRLGGESVDDRLPSAIDIQHRPQLELA